jgi:DNA-binding winged helix-turn-helix (wHTH) protein
MIRSALIAFGAHVFDPKTRCLRRGRERRDLQSQPAHLLALLLEHAGEVVTREQIRSTLWPDTTVAYDQNINFAIRQIRVALDQDANLVQTVPRHGYRLVGEVTRIEIGHAEISRRGMAAAAALLAAMVAGFGAGIMVRDARAGQFVYDHLVHPDRCPYVRMLLPIRRNS